MLARRGRRGNFIQEEEEKGCSWERGWRSISCFPAFLGARGKETVLNEFIATQLSSFVVFPLLEHWP